MDSAGEHMSSVSVFLTRRNERWMIEVVDPGQRSSSTNQVPTAIPESNITQPSYGDYGPSAGMIPNMTSPGYNNQDGSMGTISNTPHPSHGYQDTHMGAISNTPHPNDRYQDECMGSDGEIAHLTFNETYSSMGMAKRNGPPVFIIASPKGVIMAPFQID
ncbi:hypothetical protein AJ80_00388 [Polytolypa hystricis UAMH7299]|uniref:Uncharacterized protein n=1 Tax=Polytolypa hystricis (strain UAMH7299) TaxID=1447883 RepID=A0A2B7Z3Y2_POLH7|nr:hypothetical protein AJ80_00388 [Polytolypa hystricis UAMH7299]